MPGLAVKLCKEAVYTSGLFLWAYNGIPVTTKRRKSKQFRIGQFIKYLYGYGKQFVNLKTILSPTADNNPCDDIAHHRITRIDEEKAEWFFLVEIIDTDLGGAETGAGKCAQF